MVTQLDLLDFGTPGLAAAQALGPALVVVAAGLTAASLALYFKAAWAALSSL